MVRAWARLALGASASLVIVAAPAAARASAVEERSPPVITSYWDPNNQTSYVFYPDTSGNLIALSCGSGGCWRSQTVAAAGLYPLGSPLVSFFDGTQGHLFFMDAAQNHLHELYGTPPTNGNDLTAHTNPQNGGPSMVGDAFSTTGGIITGTNLAAFWNGQEHVFYFDSTSALHESYFNGSWWDHIVAPAGSPATTAGQAPWTVGGLAAAWDGTEEHVFYNSTSNHNDLYDTYYPGTCNGRSNNWCTRLVETGTQVVPYGTLSPVHVASSGAGTLDMVGDFSAFPSNLEIIPFSGNAWSTSAQLLNSPNMEYLSPVVAYDISAATSANGGVAAFYIGYDGTVYSYGTATTNSSNAASPPWMSKNNQDAWNNQVTGFFDGTNLHVFYLGADANIHEIYNSVSAYVSGAAWNQHAIGGGGRAYR